MFFLKSNFEGYDLINLILEEKPILILSQI